MNIQINRKWFTDKSTIGELLIDGVVFCYTLEDVARANGVKIPGITAIPQGSYKLIVSESVRFKKELPLIYSPESTDLSIESWGKKWSGIRLHAGNTAADSEGCIILGSVRLQDTVLDSALAVTAFMDKIKDQRFPLNITILNNQE